jgi:hypothetical protein
MSVKVDVSRNDIDDMWEIAAAYEREKVRKALDATGKAISKKLARNIKVRTRKAAHRNGGEEFAFYQRAKFKKFSEAVLALAILRQKDHMAHLTAKEDIYEVWSRITTT